VGSLVAIVRLVYTPKTLISDNATGTVNNITTHELLVLIRHSQLLTGALWIFVTPALYPLFKEVDRGFAVLMVILGSLMVTPIFFRNSVNDAAALLFVRGGEFLSPFDKPQRDAFAMLFLCLHHYCVLANEIFWGLWLLPFRAIGVQIALPAPRPGCLAARPALGSQFITPIVTKKQKRLDATDASQVQVGLFLRPLSSR
jgi:hypothetical protein